MTKADPASFADRLGKIVTESSQGLPRRTPLAAGSYPMLDSGIMPVPERQPPATALPNRYEIRDREEGRFLLCDEAPGVAVSLDRRYAFSEADARKLGERVILVDGAGQFGPLIDDAQHLYNLDHHRSCQRAFTLAACEQALVMVLKGLQLDKGEWTIYANEPDLDTLFALWVLLNYRRVRTFTPEQRDAIVPLLRLEGAIDANGFEIAEYCGLPQEVLAVAKAQLDRLHERELEAKRTGAWSGGDIYEYTLEVLLEIDHLVYESGDFSDYASVEEVYGHVEIGGEHVAVVCRDGAGIYDVEKRLKQVWGDRLGIIALEREKNQYTLRRTAGLAGIALQDAYAKLNLLDPAVDGHPPEKRWGGSDDIGGSPRPTGTGLSPREIAKILRLTYKKATRLQHLQRLSAALLWTIGLVSAGGLAVLGWRLFAPHPNPVLDASTELALSAAVIGLGASLLIRKLSRGWTWLFGWRPPSARDWLALVPAVLLGAVAGGAWVPRVVSLEGGALWAALGATALAALGLELAFRGLLHGLLILDYPVQMVRGPWFVSRPVLAAAVLYALITLGAAWLWVAPPAPLIEAPGVVWAQTALAALVAGLALGLLRERSLSLWPGVVALALGGFLRLAIAL